MKKVLFLINTLEGGGAEKVLIDIVNNLNYNKYHITVMTLINKGIYINKLNEEVQYKSINRFKTKLFRKIFSYLIHYIISPKIIYKLYIKKRYDIEIAFIEGLPVKILSASTNPKTIKYSWVHTDLNMYYAQSKIFKNINENRKCYLKFDKILCVSKESKNSFVKKFNIKENIFVQYNLVDENSIKKKSEEMCEYNFSPYFKIISVGRLVYQKGYDRLIIACSELDRLGFNFELIILGEGVEEQNLQKLINKYKLSKKIKLLGFMKNPYIYIANSDLFICSSRVEGYPLVVAESLVLGVPVLSTNCTGPNELLNYGKYGMIVGNDTISIQEGLIRIISDKSLYQYYRMQANKRSKYFVKNKRIKEIENHLDNYQK